MPEPPVSHVAIVDYGLGNLYSVKRACEVVGLQATITSDKKQILNAQAVILPGVGAFGDAMQALHKRDLISPLKDMVASGKPFMGICLGLQLLMTQSNEFGTHKGLNLIEGDVVPFERPQGNLGILKVPQVGWNHIQPAQNWSQTPLEKTTESTFLYFVHSFYVSPKNEDVILSTTQYGNITFCSSIISNNIFACQFHPERSGQHGLTIYRNWANSLQKHSSTEPIHV